MLPVSPASTATNHASLATGYSPARTGIVSNSFHLAGRPLEERVGGLYTAIGTETLWQAARRQGKQVGVVAFPGFDSAPRGNWGVDWPLKPALRSRLVALSPVRSTLGADTGCEALARDRTDDGALDYDSIQVLCTAASGAALPAVDLGVGEWRRLQLGPAGAPRGGVWAWAKLLALDARTAAGWLYVGPAYGPSMPEGYPQSYTAALGGAGWIWPGTPDEALVAAGWRGDPGIDLETWFEQEQRLTHLLIDAMIAGWRSEPTDLLLGYLPALDQAGHLLLLEDARREGYSAARRDARRLMRDRVWQMVDRELGRLLDAVDLGTTTVALVSDHGMQPVHTAIDLNTALETAGLLRFADASHIDPARTRAWALGYGGVAHVYFNLKGREPAGIVAPSEVPELRLRVLAALDGIAISAEKGTEQPVAATYSRAEAARFGLDSPNSGDLIAFAVPGYVFRSDWHQGRPLAGTPTNYGDHGYFTDVPSMRAIFLAVGGGVGKRSAGVASVLDVAPRASAWLGIDRPAAMRRLDHLPR